MKRSSSIAEDRGQGHRQEDRSDYDHVDRVA
jgi:hypothetical protein